MLESEAFEAMHLVFDIGHGGTIYTIKLVNAANQGLILSKSWLLNIHQHSTSYHAFFFFLVVPHDMQNFPNQGLNPCPFSGSAES